MTTTNRKALLILLAGMYALLSTFSQVASTATGITVSMISPYGRRRYRSNRYRRYNTQTRPSHITSAAMNDYSQHILDDENWMLDKKIRIWDPQFNIRERANFGRSWYGRITIANILCHAIQIYNPRFTHWGVKLSEKIMAGKDLYRLITPIFLHGDLFHLFTNMYSLKNIGPTTEKLFGPGRFLAMYMVAGALCNLLSAMISPNPALGASGALFGVTASLYVFLARNRGVMGQTSEAISSDITQNLLINLVMGAFNPMVDNWGHIGGAIGGAAMAWYFGPRLYLAPFLDSQVIVDKPYVRLPRISIESRQTRIRKKKLFDDLKSGQIQFD